MELATKIHEEPALKTPDTTGYRIEFDDTIGLHINVFCKKEIGPHFVIPGKNRNDLEAILDQLFPPR